MYVSYKAEGAIGQKYRTIYPVKGDSGDSYLIDGWVIPKERADVFYDESEYNALHQELLQRREEVRELMRRLELAEKAGENAAREVNRLSAELEQRKPKLPREVAKAIEWARKSVRPTNRDILEYVINPDGSYPTIVEWGRTNFDELLEALVNGYTIKEPDIRSEIQMIVEDSKDDYEMIDQLADLFQTRLDQEMQKSG